MKLFYFLCTLSVLFSSAYVRAQDSNKRVTIIGTVQDTIGQPLANVSVYVIGSPAGGTSSNANGQFELSVMYGDKVGFSLVGFQPVEHLAIRNELSLVITMEESTSDIEEVMVVGLQNVQRKVSSVGAITSVDVKDLQSPAPSITNLLGGRAPGIISMQTSGEPGANIADFWIR